MPAVSAAYMSGFQNGFQTGFQHGTIPMLQQHNPVSGHSGFALEAPNLFLEDSSSGELDGYTMMDTTFEQAQAWQSSLLEVTEVPASEQGDESRSVASFEFQHAVPAAAGTAQHAEDAVSQASPRVQPAVRAFEHAVPAVFGPAGMLPPEHESGTSQHDWLALPAEGEQQQQAPANSDSPQAMHDWLSLQQADCLASGRRLSSEWTGFGNGPAVHQAASSTPSITPGSSFGSTFGQYFQANRQQQPDEATGAEASKQDPLPSDISYGRLHQLGQACVDDQAAAASGAQQPDRPQQAQHAQQAAGEQSEWQPATQQPAFHAPLARWSSTPILGPQSGQDHGSAGESQQAQRVPEQQHPAQHAQQHLSSNQQVQQAQQHLSSNQQAQHAQQAKQVQHAQQAKQVQHAQQAEQVQSITGSNTGSAAEQQAQDPAPSYAMPTQSDSLVAAHQGSGHQQPADTPSTELSQAVTAIEDAHTVQPDLQQAGSLQDSADTSGVHKSLLLTFAPAGDLGVPERQHPFQETSPSSSRALSDSPGMSCTVYIPGEGVIAVAPGSKCRCCNADGLYNGWSCARHVLQC